MAEKAIRYLYGKFAPRQLSEHKHYLHSSLHWLLIYKDPKSSDQWKNVNVDQYMDTLLRRIGGLNDLFKEPPSLVTLMSVLQAARNEVQSQDFDWSVFRKLVLDAQALIDTLPDESSIEGR